MGRRSSLYVYCLRVKTYMAFYERFQVEKYILHFLESVEIPEILKIGFTKELVLSQN